MAGESGGEDRGSGGTGGENSRAKDRDREGGVRPGVGSSSKLQLD